MPTPSELAGYIEQRIQCRTHGRVRRVSVEFDDQRAVLRGDAVTYYAKQLAQHAASEMLEGRVLVNAIEVA
jgi:hypothetical protein